jgi:hypothetical protein
VPLANTHHGIGAGLVGELGEAMEEKAFLECSVWGIWVIRWSGIPGDRAAGQKGGFAAAQVVF